MSLSQAHELINEQIPQPTSQSNIFGVEFNVQPFAFLFFSENEGLKFVFGFLTLIKENNTVTLKILQRGTSSSSTHELYI